MKKKKLFTIIYMKSFINLIIASIYEIMKINKKIKMEKKLLALKSKFQSKRFLPNVLSLLQTSPNSISPSVVWNRCRCANTSASVHCKRRRSTDRCCQAYTFFLQDFRRIFNLFQSRLYFIPFFLSINTDK